MINYLFFIILINYNYYNVFTLCEFFISVLDIRSSLKFEWQLIPSGLPFLFSKFWLFSTMLWSVWILSLISNSSCPLSKPLGTVLSAPTIIGNSVIIMFYSFFISQARSKYLYIFFFVSLLFETSIQLFFFAFLFFVFVVFLSVLMLPMLLLAAVISLSLLFLM